MSLLHEKAAEDRSQHNNNAYDGKHAYLPDARVTCVAARVKAAIMSFPRPFQ